MCRVFWYSFPWQIYYLFLILALPFSFL
jgi:hypothetical protein